MLLILIAALAATSHALPLEEAPWNFLAQETCGYDSCTQAEPNLLNVHIVPHTHDDVGWLKTVDQYYYGSRNNIQKAGVQYIIDSVVNELWEDPKRRFMYVETAFFWKWWVRQTESRQEKVRTLVRQGRLQFVSGAWSMNDEADTHYQSTIDQFTWGLRKLNDTFGPCGMPRTGWQIDPFGHSREFASLLAAMGYDGLFLGRIDYEDKNRRKYDKRMEMLWRGDDDLGKKSDIFTGVLYNTYSPPPGFCFDVLCSDEPIIDDLSSPMYNVEKRINEFLITVNEAKRTYLTNNILITMGGDFTYQDAGMWYHNLDKLIQYTNLKAAKEGLNIKLFYSTPDCYLKAVRDANPTLPTKQDDFFPYASDPHAFWTGYFTSRPTVKFFEREGNNYLQMAKQLQVTARLDEHNMFVLDELKSAMGIMQHHDAVTGTEKQHVANDYERILDGTIEDSLIIARQAFNKVMQGDSQKPALYSYDRCRFNESQCATSEDSSQFVVTLYNPLAWKLEVTPVRIPVKYGHYTVVAPNGQSIDYQLVELSEKLSDIPSRESRATHEIVFLAYNVKALGIKNFFIKKTKQEKRDTESYKDSYGFYSDYNKYWNVKKEPQIFIKSLERNKAFGEERIPDPPKKVNAPKKEIYSDLSSDIMKDSDKQYSYVEELERLIKELRTESSTENRGVRRTKLMEMSDDEMRLLADDPLVVQRNDDIFLTNTVTKLVLDTKTGEPSHIIREDGSVCPFRMKLMFYPGCKGYNRNYTDRASGAYIFRPNATEATKLPFHVDKVIQGSIVNELHYSSAISGVIRMYKHPKLSFIEHEWMVGPIDVDDNVGKEMIVRYSTDIANKGQFFTDSNGRQMIKRVLNRRPQWNLTLYEPISGNYYPVVNKMFIQDEAKRMTVLTDRAEGGTSLHDGELELMLHRRLLYDDAFGVDEALDETVDGKGLIARGKHRIMILDPKEKTQKVTERKHGLEFHLQPRMFVSKSEHVDLSQWLTLHNCLGAVSTALPDGLHLLTLEPWSPTKLLLRLENYLEISDGGSTDITFDLSTLFSNIELLSLKETKLAANRWIDAEKQWVWNTEIGFFNSFNNAYGDLDATSAVERDSAHNDNEFIINVKAKEIRTFIIDFTYKNVKSVN